MSRFKNNISQLLSNAGLAIENGQSIPEIFAAVAQWGYDQTRFEEGAQLHQQAAQLVADQVRVHGEQLEIHADLLSARNQTQTLYEHHRALVRIALKNDAPRLAALGIGGYHQQSFNGWLGEVNTFYTHLQDDALVLQKLSAFNFGPSHIEQAREAVQRVVELNSLHKQKRTVAQETTRTRDHALHDLAEWLSSFRVVAHLALAATPDVLLALGFK